MIISKSLNNRLARHLKVLQIVDGDESLSTKSQWISKAVQEKLNRDSESSDTEKGLVHCVTIRMDKDLIDEVREVVNSEPDLKSFNKNTWILEAIHEKLEKEQAKYREALKKLTET